jgi:hypothetical protein
MRMKELLNSLNEKEKQKKITFDQIKESERLFKIDHKIKIESTDEAINNLKKIKYYQY